MEGNNGSSGESNRRPPIPLAAAAATTTTSCGQCFSIDSVPVSCKKTLVRHQSLVKTKTLDISVKPNLGAENHDADFVPIVRSGAWADIGFRSSMEDVYICADSFMSDYGLKNATDGPNAFYGVFDGHGGKHAADFACYHLPRFIAEDEDFPVEVERVIASAFLQTDSAFAKACSLDAALASGTTALAALVVGRLLVVANAGDCRAVLCCRGNAVDMSNDHKPTCSKERKRIEASGGYVYDGYLNGLLNVARALGDWHMEGLKGSGSDGGPLSAEPEFMTRQLTEEDEFIIIGCDGIWDVFRSQNAVDFARRRLQEHNDPVMCSKDLVDEALKRKSGDNLAVIVVCFQSEPPRNLIAPRPRVHRSISADGLRELQSVLDDLAK
ncbi:PREDICTED: probable protein phosphatase 2C 57 [Populus euphratica]|uniref:protein-serine/threonine phosphatase n=1 Tax=Populus euphratica TaxID=75702 RepID=A0AAJ6XI22_POPEU|nr:PREDICTED: probable protein phosphatase 2C 57 [Populus euphratica]